MTAAGLRLDRLRQIVQADPEAASIIASVGDSIGSAIARLRHLMFDLRPRSLDEGLLPALRESLAYLCEQCEISFSLEGSIDDEPPPDVRVIAFRIIQEALSNVRRHSGASTCVVRVGSDPRGLLVQIQDDGLGFDPGDEVRSPAGHLGLSSIRERAEGAGGWLTVLSAAGVGTTVEFLLPVEGDRDPKEGTHDAS